MPRIAASLQYRFGALQERNGEHGAAHFLEHAIHQGTTTVGVKDRDLDRKLFRTIYDTEQELLAERNAHRNDVRERRVFFDEGEWPETANEHRLRQKLYALEDDKSRSMVNFAIRDGTLVTDRVFRRGVLVVMAGDREQHLVFENRAWNTAPAGRGRE